MLAIVRRSAEKRHTIIIIFFFFLSLRVRYAIVRNRGTTGESKELSVTSHKEDRDLRLVFNVRAQLRAIINER